MRTAGALSPSWETGSESLTSIGWCLDARTLDQKYHWSQLIASMERVVREYPTAEGRGPVRDWLEPLDVAVRARIQAQVPRFENGSLGDHETVGEGVFEARLDFGPGYWIHFGRRGGRVILLLTRRDKSTQARDICAAGRHWAECLEATKHVKAQ